MVSIDKSYEPLGNHGLAEFCVALIKGDCEELEGKKKEDVVELDLGGNELTGGCSKTLVEILPHLPKLKNFDVRDNKIGAALDDIVYALPTWRLQRLDLSNNLIKDYGAAVVAYQLPQLRSLTELELVDDGIGPKGAESLAKALADHPTLTFVSLGYNQMGDAGAAVLAENLVHNRSLTHLDLADNGIGNDGCEALSKWLGSKNCVLQNLGLCVNKIDGDGVRHMADALLTNKRTTTIDIGCNPIGSQGAIYLFEALKTNTTLTDLDITTCELDNDCAQTMIDSLTINKTLIDLKMYVNEDMDMSKMEVIFRLFMKNAEDFKARTEKKKQVMKGLAVGAALCLAYGIFKFMTRRRS